MLRLDTTWGNSYKSTGTKAGVSGVRVRDPQLSVPFLGQWAQPPSVVKCAASVSDSLGFNPDLITVLSV